MGKSLGEINLKKLHLEGALDLADTIPFTWDSKVKEDRLVLYSGDAFDALIGYLVGEEVYLFSEEQATNFSTSMLRNAKRYEIEAVKQMKEETGEMHHSYMKMNPSQAKIYLSVNIDRLVPVKVADINRIFRRKLNDE